MYILYHSVTRACNLKYMACYQDRSLPRFQGRLISRSRSVSFNSAPSHVEKSQGRTRERECESENTTLRSPLRYCIFTLWQAGPLEALTSREIVTLTNLHSYRLFEM